MKYINASPQRRQKFYNMQTHGDDAKPILNLTLDCKTRWNSTFLMLRRAYRLKVAVKDFIATEDDIKRFRLTAEDWKHIEYLMKLLFDFYQMTTLLSQHKRATAHEVCLIDLAVNNIFTNKSLGLPCL